tara:strand:+ start:1077 stop:1490 length:414 start_codon:yes stop_codon:yes gene_type:complete
MSNTTKLKPDVLSSIFEELAKGEQSIKAILKDRDITYEALRKLLNKKPKIREEYDLAVQDGISLALDTAVFRIKETIEDLKNHPNQKSSLAISNLEKEINSMIKYRSSALLSKYQPKSSLKVGNINDKPLLVKWLSK